MGPRHARRIALVGIGAWLGLALILWWGGSPLGHDEARFALSAQAGLAGEPPRWFYLGRGMDVLTAPGLWLGASERALRIAPLLAGLGFVAAAWQLARRVVGEGSAAWALVVLATTRHLVKWSAELLSDLPAAACLLAALAVIVDEIDREDGPRWRLVGAAPLLAAAFYLRYGSIVPIAVIGVCGVAVGARALRRRPAPALVTAGVLVLLLVPHLVGAMATTGSPLGILIESGGVPPRAYPGEGLVTYLSTPLRSFGLLAPVVLLAGLIGVRGLDRRRALVWLVAVGALGVIGLITHAQTRYVVVSIVGLTVLGTDVLRRGLAARSPRVRRGGGVVAVLALVVVWGQLVRSFAGAEVQRRHAMRGTLAAAGVIRADAAGAPCRVLATHATQLEWYAGCAVPLVLGEAAVREGLMRGERVYVVRDLTPAWAPVAQPAIDALPGLPRVLLDEPGVISVVRLGSRGPSS